MKRRDHIATVSFLLGAAVFLLMGNAATAQEFMPPPAFYSGTPSLVYGRFYVQGGVQYRNIQRLGFRKFVVPYQVVQDWGAAPFAADQEGPFGAATGVQGYPPFPDGISADPNTSGIWLYDNGAFITPNGNTFDDNTGTVVESATLWNTTHGGLGQKMIVMTTGAGHFANDGVFLIADTPNNVDNGFDLSGSLNFTDTRKVSFRRTLDATVNGYGNGRESLIWRTYGSEIRDKEFVTNAVSPTLEFGFQWTNFFDLFSAFSWYDLDANSGSIHPLTASLMRRGIRDTFPYTSSRTGTWQGTAPVGIHESSLIETVEGVWDQILPNAPSNGVSPSRVFFFTQDLSVPAMQITETVSMHADVRIYEYKLGARSWVPLYGLGRFGIVFGPMLNQINYNASVNRVATFPLTTGTVSASATSSNKGTLLSWGAFAGGDIEGAFGPYFGKFAAFYHITEEKALKNADTPELAVDTNINLSGFNMAFNLGCRF